MTNRAPADSYGRLLIKASGRAKTDRRPWTRIDSRMHQRPPDANNIDAGVLKVTTWSRTFVPTGTSRLATGSRPRTSMRRGTMQRATLEIVWREYSAVVRCCSSRLFH
ncbi:hypothetical protein DOTSEDRAFT_44187 [Dothistroma septosporum NZE10]|uniref:Uncharacterized protein n=1 Tax=Dothistroma septosporum (strain NZE10 / CBS 128990) TaxID=675120 RepID=N1PN56_DOTSN|nr:hypothetical protein DOTSEDRAFT_44187 [Dothistroma septosporum NZE10]